MKRFRTAKTEREEQESLEAAIPSNTRYSTSWAYKSFKEWQGNRQNKVAANEPRWLKFNDSCKYENLDTKLEYFNVESLNFWLVKFVQEIAKKNEEYYPP